MYEYDVIRKPEVHKVSQRRQRRTEPRYCTKFGKVRTCTVRDRVVPEMGSRRDRQTRTLGVTTNHTLILVGRVPSNFGEHGEVYVFGILQLLGGSVAEWLACWTQAQKGLGSNRSHAVG